MDKPVDEPLQGLLKLTLREFGVEAEHCTDNNWPDKSRLLLTALNSWFLSASQRAQAKLQHDLSDRLFVVPFGWQDRSPLIGGVNVRPPDSFYFREDAAFDQIPKGINGGEFYICAELGGARSSSIPDGFLSPVVYLSFHVGYRACEPLKWLIKNWRRPLEKLLLPLKSDVDINGFENPSVKAFRGKDAVRRSELYLADPGDDPVVTYHTMLHHRTSDEDAERILAVFLAIYDAIYSLQTKRCDPDRLHRHFLALESTLSTLPFREGFYDPGQTHRELIEDWNRLHPKDLIPLDVKWPQASHE